MGGTGDTVGAALGPWLLALLIGHGALTTAGDWLLLFTHFLMLSLLAIGGAITTAPDMQRFVVKEHGWISDAQFTGSVALAQAAPGPNVLFVAVIGFNVAGLAGMLVTMVGTLLPSTTLALAATRWGERNRGSRGMRAFTTGLAPLTIGLLLATGWILLAPVLGDGVSWRWGPAALLVAGTLAWMLRTRFSPLWPICAGAVVGALGWV